MENRKLIALDLDGTLLDDNKNISDITKKYLKELEDRGNIICLTSGRPPRAIESHYKDIGLKTSPYIGYNGDLICDKKNNEFTIFETMPKSFFVDFFNEFNFEKFPYIAAEDLDHLYLNVKDVLFDDFLHTSDTEVVIGKMPDIFQGDLYAFFFKIYEEEMQERVNKFVSKYDNIEVRFWYDKPDFGEFFPKNISKEIGLREVQKRFDIKDEDTIAFGDGNNDFEMLKYAKTSFAMKNGSENLKKQSKNITEYTNNEDGVYRELFKIFK